MRWLKPAYSIISSNALTVWLVGISIFYYLTVAVWSEEAFATLLSNISSNNAFRALYILFFLNVLFRVLKSARATGTKKYRAFLKLPVYAGLLLFLLSFFMSLNVRKSKWLLAGEGDVIRFEWMSSSLKVLKIDPALKSDLLRTDDSIIFDYEPIITLGGREGDVYKIGAFPPKSVKSTYMHILNFGIGPGIELREHGETASKGYMALRLIPFGAVDSFEIKPYPYKFSVRILPNDVIKKGDAAVKNYNLDMPLYEVEIVKGDKMIMKDKSDSTLFFDTGMSIDFFKPSFWVLLEAVYDPWLVWFVAGIIIMLVGTILYPLGVSLRRTFHTFSP